MYFTERDFDKYSFAEIKQLFPEQWNKLDSTQRLAVLQDLEDCISKHENRQRALVVERNLGAEYNGIYNRPENRIEIDSEKLRTQPVYDSFKTLIEESRHAYQCHAVENKEERFHPDLSEVKDWESGLETYSSDIKHPYLYKNNPFEKHARLHSERLTNLLRSEHEQTLSQDQLRLSGYSYHFEPHQNGATLILEDGKGNEVRKFLVSDMSHEEIQKVQLSPQQIEGLMKLEVGKTQTIGNSREQPPTLNKENPPEKEISPITQANQQAQEPQTPTKESVPTQNLNKDRDRDR